MNNKRRLFWIIWEWDDCTPYIFSIFMVYKPILYTSITFCPSINNIYRSTIWRSKNKKWHIENYHDKLAMASFSEPSSNTYLNSYFYST